MSSLKDKVPLWFQEFSQMSQSEREKVMDDTLKAVACFNSTDGKPTSDGRALVVYLRRECLIQGLTYETCYSPVQGGNKELQSLFIHKYGLPTLLYVHKRLPFVLNVNPAIRKDAMVLSEIPANSTHFRHVYTVGITG